jgi:hypothetical protein
MTGWTAVAVITGLALLVLVGLNVRLYRAMKAATAKGRQAQTPERWPFSGAPASNAIVPGRGSVWPRPR